MKGRADQEAARHSCPRRSSPSSASCSSRRRSSSTTSLASGETKIGAAISTRAAVNGLGIRRASQLRVSDQ